MFKGGDVESLETVQNRLPDESRRKKGPYAVIECFRSIPCNFCAIACSEGAIADFTEINVLPKLDLGKCNGCGECVGTCPGLACFIIDETFSELESMLMIPYELVPLPKVGQMVVTLDREGNPVGHGRVLKVQNQSSLKKINVVTTALPKDQVNLVRHIGFNEPTVIWESATART